MNTFTLLIILRAFGATPDHYGFFDIEVRPGYTQQECAKLNHDAVFEQRNEVCDMDERIAQFVHAHGCEAQPVMVISSSIYFRCTR